MDISKEKCVFFNKITKLSSLFSHLLSFYILEHSDNLLFE